MSAIRIVGTKFGDVLGCTSVFAIVNESRRSSALLLWLITDTSLFTIGGISFSDMVKCSGVGSLIGFMCRSTRHMSPRSVVIIPNSLQRD